ncbi:MAG: TetR/AcrR family transcriptional regulator [Candidatus Nanopelagicales bacterium]|nr:TetR/AcrR family transcriptional regulator [Candidatus Nanopelagicales bacterium]
MSQQLQGATTRERMIDSAVVLLRERGSNAVTMDAVLALSGAPRGSVYHHFPGGRDELVLAALNRSGAAISGMLDRSLSSGDTAMAVRTFVRFWSRTLRESDYRAGCPIAASAVDSQNPVADSADVVERTFAEWHRRLAASLVADGYPRSRSRRLATTIVASIEGALILCRAQRTTRPLDDVSAEIRVLLEDR